MQPALCDRAGDVVSLRIEGEGMDTMAERTEVEPRFPKNRFSTAARNDRRWCLPYQNAASKATWTEESCVAVRV